MLPKFRSFVRSFIVTIHHSFIQTIHHHYSVLLFTVAILCCYYLLTMFIIVTIHHYYSPLQFIIVTIHRWYLSLLFGVTIHRYYSSIIRSPQISTTHSSCCPVLLRPARPIFQSYKLRWLWFSSSKNFPSGHPSQVSPSWARLSLRFLRTRLPNSDSNNSCS
jgi:hypothetical protein